MVENRMEAPPNGDTRRRGRGGRVGVGERERVAGQETSSADEVIGLKIKRWRHLKPIPVNELSGARGERRRQARAGRGAGAPGGASQRSSPRGGRSGGSGRRARVTFPTDRPTVRSEAEPGGARRSLARGLGCLLRACALPVAPGSRPSSAGLQSARPLARGSLPKPPTLVQRNHGDPNLGPSLGKKVLESKIQGSSLEREVAGTLRKTARARVGRHSPTPSSLKGKALHDCLFLR